MKQLTTRKLCSMAIIACGVLFLGSCAGDGFSDESFRPGNGATGKLTTPAESDIMIEVSTDGAKQTVSWPVVFGASGYRAVLTNVSTNEVLVDSIIDNLSFATSREEDTNYKLTLQALGNQKLGTTDGDEVLKAFSSFTATYAKIPAGSDLYEYFKNNALPDDQEGDVNYDLEAGGKYTLSGQLDFNYHKVCLRSSDKGHHATIDVLDNASFVVSNNFSLKYLDINIKATSPETVRPVIELYNYETEPEGILEKPKNYYLINAVNVIGCNFTNVIGSFIYDNNKAYAVMGLTIKNTLIQANTTASKIKNQAFISFEGGGVKDFTMNNCTVYETGEKINKYFLRYNNSLRVDRITGSTTDFTTFTWINNTFYNLLDNSDGQWFNSKGPANYSTYSVLNNIWVDCSKQIARRLKADGRLGTNSQARFLHNTYWADGEAADQGEHDTSGTALTTDPAFEDAANADFTPTGAEQVQYQTGDSRWFE